MHKICGQATPTPWHTPAFLLGTYDPINGAAHHLLYPAVKGRCSWAWHKPSTNVFHLIEMQIYTTEV